MKLKQKSPLIIGLVLMAVSTLIWCFPFIVPFLDLSGRGKAGLSAVLIVTAEILFWIGVLLAGKEAAKSYKRWVNPASWYQKIKGRP
ncbi:transporter suffix domain-containing protein [Peribacillus kribbensis]|uniref:transporter suffix domain-containing protein n=1 Tax=Peribacillus kribbensis TaxID=356658 RepID=UPI00047B63B9|nr:transporter suffix domain-containing protein [Peribacillus kribbensis]